MKPVGFLVIILWLWLKCVLFGTHETLREFDTSTQRLVEETTQVVVALYDYSLEEAQPYLDDVTSGVESLALAVDTVTSSTAAFTKAQNQSLRRRLQVAGRIWNDGKTSAALATADLGVGVTSASVRLRNAYHKARQRFR